MACDTEQEVAPSSSYSQMEADMCSSFQYSIEEPTVESDSMKLDHLFFLAPELIIASSWLGRLMLAGTLSQS